MRPNKAQGRRFNFEPIKIERLASQKGLLWHQPCRPIFKIRASNRETESLKLDECKVCFIFFELEFGKRSRDSNSRDKNPIFTGTASSIVFITRRAPRVTVSLPFSSPPHPPRRRPLPSYNAVHASSFIHPTEKRNHEDPKKKESCIIPTFLFSSPFSRDPIFRGPKKQL